MSEILPRCRNAAGQLPQKQGEAYLEKCVMSEAYYICRDFKSQEGPFSLEELKGIVATGAFKREHLVWTSGMPDWSKAAQSTGLFDELPPPIPGSEPEAAPTIRQDNSSPTGPDVPPADVNKPFFVSGVAAVGVPTFAGFWRRVLAALLDGILVLTATLILTVFAFSGVVFVVVGWLYYAFMESSAKQATLGKLAMGIRVTDMDNKRLDFGRATGRFFGKFVSMLTLCIGFIMAAFTDRKQALHDQIAKTLVLRTQ